MKLVLASRICQQVENRTWMGIPKSRDNTWHLSITTPKSMDNIFQAVISRCAKDANLKETGRGRNSCYTHSIIKEHRHTCVTNRT
jgi:hypothetical protein